jgi:hypothetical protein
MQYINLRQHGLQRYLLQMMTVMIVVHDSVLARACHSLLCYLPDAFSSTPALIAASLSHIHL